MKISEVKHKLQKKLGNRPGTYLKVSNWNSTMTLFIVCACLILSRNLLAVSGASFRPKQSEDDVHVSTDRRQFPFKADDVNSTVPAPNPASITIANKTSTSICLRLDKSVRYDEFILFFEPQLSGQMFMRLFAADGVVNETDAILLNVTDLAPSTTYTLSISNCSNYKCDSLNSTSATTLSAPPHMPRTLIPPPKAEKFDFHIDRVEGDRRTVRVFWNPQPEVQNMKLGNHVTAKIYEEDRLVSEEEFYGKHNMVKDISLKAHTFALHTPRWFPNVESRNATIVEVPAQSDLLSLPAFVASRLPDGEFEYSWLLPDPNKLDPRIQMVWCFTDDFELRACSELIEHVPLPAGRITAYRTKNGGQNSYKALALRVDTESSSTGVVLPACQSDVSDVGTLDEQPKIAVNDSQMSIEWGLRCPEEGIVHGVSAYNVRYCALQNSSCVQPETKLRIKTQETSLKMVIDDFKPKMSYLIEASVVLDNGKESSPRTHIFYPHDEDKL